MLGDAWKGVGMELDSCSRSSCRACSGELGPRGGGTCTQSAGPCGEELGQGTLQKLLRLHDLIRPADRLSQGADPSIKIRSHRDDCFESALVAFRASNWGAGAETAEALRAAGTRRIRRTRGWLVQRLGAYGSHRLLPARLASNNAIGERGLDAADLLGSAAQRLLTLAD